MDTPGNIATRDKTALHYRVGGMDCPSCAGKIETAVERLGGIDGIQVDYHSQTLRLRLDEQVTSRTAVEGRIRSLGYEVAAAVAPTLSMGNVSSPHMPASTAQAWWRTRKIRPLLTIGSLLALGAMVEPFLPAIGGWTELPTAIVGLWSASRRAIALARAGSPFSIEMLMSVAAIGALFIGAPAEAAVVVFLFTAGEAMEGFAAGRARAGIQALSALVPRTALLIDGQEVRPVSADTVQVGQTVLVRPGDRVPVDGIVLEGASELDQSPITGESVPVAKQEGDTLLAGSINGSAALRVQTTRAASDNTIARIVRLVEEAQASRAPTARFIERFSTFYTPAVVLVALLTVLVPPLAFGAGWMTWTYRGLALLLIGCPSALVLSTPAAITSGLAAGARRGLLIKGGAALETVGRVRTIAFDKTGTLTRGEPTLTDLVAFGGATDSIASSAAQERAVLGLAASVESGSSHAIAQAILRQADTDGVPLRPVRNIMAIPGRAATATILGKSVVVGSPRYVATLVPLSSDLEQQISALEEVGKTVVLVVLDDQVKGLLALRDEPREDALSGLAALRRLGIRPVMLTGDNRRTADAIGKTLGVDAYAELLPEDKLQQIATLKSMGPVAMVGDGINDAPALAAASVGIAMGGATDVALETADAAVLRARVGDIADLVCLSRATMRNIHQNVAVALGLKALFLVTTLAGITGLWPAILADTGATVLVTMNALRLLRHRGTTPLRTTVQPLRRPSTQ